jgi:flagellar motility protein MotE (MotC chaperone)
MVAGLVFGGGQALAEGGFRLRSNLRKLNTTPGGVERIQQLLIEQGMSADDAAAALQKLGPEGKLLDVGADTGAVLRQEAQRIHARGGEGRATINKGLETRKANQEAGLQADLEATVGPRQQPSDISSALQNRLIEAQAAQKASHAQQVQPVDLARMADDIDARLATAKSATEIAALKKVRKLLTEAPGDPTATPPVAETLETTSQQVLKVRQAIRDELYSAKTGQIREDLSPGAKQVLQEAYDEINKGLDPANPTLRAADAEIHQIGKEETAFDTGQKIYENPRGALTEVEFKQAYDAMSPGEQARILDGLNVETYRQVGIQGNTLTKLKDLMKGEGKWNQQKVAAVIGEEKAQKLMDAISNRAIFQDSYQKIVQGSKTAESSTGNKPEGFVSTAAKAVPEVIAGGVIGGPGGSGAVALARLKDWLTKRGTAGHSPALDADVAKLLDTNKGEDLVKAVQELAKKQGGEARTVLMGLVARDNDRRRGQ